MQRLQTHMGGCHCGAVQFEVYAPSELKVSECNCSICYKSGFLGVIVPKAQFKLTSPSNTLSTYTFNTGTAKHHFCHKCGIKSFYIPRSHPEGVSVNLRCLDKANISTVHIKPFDGQNWERYYPEGQAENYPMAEPF